MQKVITITTHTNIVHRDNKFSEKEYPTLDKYLQEGYKVVQAIPMSPDKNSYMYSLTFILEKQL